MAAPGGLLSHCISKLVEGVPDETNAVQVPWFL
jgi:hypothetical protein